MSLLRIVNERIMSQQAITQLLAEYFKTQPVLKAWLFESFARDEQREDSDVDILFVPDMSQNFSLFTLGGMYMDLKDLLGREVDLTIETWAFYGCSGLTSITIPNSVTTIPVFNVSFYN